MVPRSRLRVLGDAPVRPAGAYVLYWMIAARRTRHSHGLARAAELAADLGRPLLVLEALRVDHPLASDRLHAFVLGGMADNRRALAAVPGVRHYAYLEPAPGAGRGLLAALAGGACAVVTDDALEHFLPRMVAAAASRLPVRLEAVDGAGLLPLSASRPVRAQPVHFRRDLQKRLLAHLAEAPPADPLAGLDLPGAPRIPRAIRARWPEATDAELAGDTLARLPIDHRVPVAPIPGGARAAEARLAGFLERLDGYAAGRDHPDDGAASGLSPYLHFGHLSVHAVFDAVARRDGFTPEALAPPTGRRGWFGLSPSAEAFLEQLVTWRELARNAYGAGDPRTYASLPPWARETLEAHQGDPRPHRYRRAAFEAAATHDPVWNACQRELLETGTVHPYLRMLWGKKILEWSDSPRAALSTMIALNDRWALDGRDPSSYAGIGWVLGRYDRPWPERAIYGRVRSMSSARTVKKVRMARYLARYGEGRPG